MCTASDAPHRANAEHGEAYDCDIDYEDGTVAHICIEDADVGDVGIWAPNKTCDEVAAQWRALAPSP